MTWVPIPQCTKGDMFIGGTKSELKELKIKGEKHVTTSATCSIDTTAKLSFWKATKTKAMKDVKDIVAKRCPIDEIPEDVPTSRK